MISDFLILAAASSLVWLLHNSWMKWTTNPRQLPHPPGPRGYPIIGAMLDLPLKNAWLVYDQWFKKYGRFYAFSNVK
jgi:hypothetical protein